MKAVWVSLFALLLLMGCGPDESVPDQTLRREQRRVAELSAEVEQTRAAQRSTERSLIVAGCALAVLVAALIQSGRRGG